MGFLWDSCGILVGFLWDSCGILVGFLWDSCGILVDSCGILVGFLWDSCGILGHASLPNDPKRPPANEIEHQNAGPRTNTVDGADTSLRAFIRCVKPIVHERKPMLSCQVIALTKMLTCLIAVTMLPAMDGQAGVTSSQGVEMPTYASLQSLHKKHPTKNIRVLAIWRKHLANRKLIFRGMFKTNNSFLAIACKGSWDTEDVPRLAS